MPLNYNRPNGNCMYKQNKVTKKLNNYKSTHYVIF